MSHLDDIIRSVQRKGRHEERWHALLQCYFTGEDGFYKITAWAKSVGLSVIFSDEYQTCTFQAIRNDPATQDQPVKPAP